MKIGGEPANPCWMMKEDTRFYTIEQCQHYAERQEATVAARLAQNYDMPPVVSVQCGAYEGMK
jgi:hypothetical protein